MDGNFVEASWLHIRDESTRTLGEARPRLSHDLGRQATLLTPLGFSC